MERKKKVLTMKAVSWNKKATLTEDKGLKRLKRLRGLKAINPYLFNYQVSRSQTLRSVVSRVVHDYRHWMESDVLCGVY
jgi:hypothetical protein